MKVSELRIGNYLNYIEKMYKGEPDQIIKVSAIFDFGIKTKEFGNTRMGTLDNFEVIPLTEEWLVKFGFYSSDMCNGLMLPNDPDENECPFYGFTFQDGYFCCLDCTHEEITIKKTLMYVHELQNLFFALTGEELTIKK